MSSKKFARPLPSAKHQEQQIMFLDKANSIQRAHKDVMQRVFVSSEIDNISSQVEMQRQIH